MRALRDMNLPKFVFEDVPLFLGLISDLFPGMDCPRVRYPSFNDAVEQVLEENGFVILPVQVEAGPSPASSSLCYLLEWRPSTDAIEGATLSVQSIPSAARPPRPPPSPGRFILPTAALCHKQ